MQPQSNGANGTSENQCLHCPDSGDLCPAHKMAEILGANVQDILVSFIYGAENGARLTLQKTPTGFTVQVTGAARRSGELDSSDVSGSPARGLRLGAHGPPTARVDL